MPVLLWQWLSLQRVLQESHLSLGFIGDVIQTSPTPNSAAGILVSVFTSPHTYGQNLDSPVNTSGAVFEVRLQLIAFLVKFWHQL